MGEHGVIKRCGAAVVAALLGGPVLAQTPVSPSVDERIDALSREVAELKALVQQLKDQLAASGKPAPAPTGPGAAATTQVPPATPAPATAAPPATPAPPATAAAAAAAATPPGGEFWHGVTFNALLDGYYEYNFNAPVGRVNSLRAYDVSSNSFSLNQADLVIERAPDLAADQRLGMRLDLQFGQATSTLQGNPSNELRPDVYRNVFQAYGTYVFPIAAGLSVDFGKWASSLGIEGNYTKDQLNYSRSFWFDFLPFYHMGVRAKLALNDVVAVDLWITNGTNQTEAFNNYKDQLLGVVITPTPALAWTVNLYQGQEHPDVVYITNPTPAQSTLPNQQGTYILPITNPANGKLDIADSYLSWQATHALLLAAEADWVQERLYSTSVAQRVDGGALYAGYQFSSRFAVAARAEYLADIGGLFTGVRQYLREETLTLDYRPADGFLLRGEFRRDHSNRPYFLGSTLGDLEASQPTIGLGLVWWFGQKDGAW